jgi:hypothetical protein
MKQPLASGRSRATPGRAVPRRHSGHRRGRSLWAGWTGADLGLRTIAEQHLRPDGAPRQGREGRGGHLRLKGAGACGRVDRLDQGGDDFRGALRDGSRAVGAMATAAAMMSGTTWPCSAGGTARIAAQAQPGASGARWSAGRAAMAAETTRGASDKRGGPAGSAPTTSLTMGSALSGVPATISCAVSFGAATESLVTESTSA